jgi:hypothetical protein
MECQRRSIQSVELLPSCASKPMCHDSLRQFGAVDARSRRPPDSDRVDRRGDGRAAQDVGLLEPLATDDYVQARSLPCNQIAAGTITG